MKNLDTFEKFSDFKQELQAKLRALHCLIQDAECFHEDIIMGLLHQERKIISELEEILEALNESRLDN